MKITVGNIIISFLLAFNGIVQVQGQATGYTIHGRLTGLHDATFLYLVRDNKGKADTLSVTQSNGEQFSFKGQVPLEGEPYFINLDTLNPAYKHLKRRYILVHMENHLISISGSVHDLDPFGIEVMGSTTHKDLMDFSRELKRRFVDPNNERRDRLLQIIRSKDSSASALEQRNVLKRAMARTNEEEIPTFKKEWVLSHPNSLISPWIVLRENDSIHVFFYRKLAETSRRSYWGVQLKEQIERSDKLSIGRKAPELNLMTVEDRPLSLHAVAKNHKLTLIEFWASWCFPCREQFPKLKELYNKYKDKGFAIYGISLDSKKEEWLAALKVDDLPWHNVIMSNDAGKVNARDLYNINLIPAFVLLDQHGGILLKGLSGKTNVELEVMLSRL